jgi:cell volume regulation protein A
MFHVVFFVVLVSALIQGVSLPPAARALGLHTQAPPAAPITLEITSLRHLSGDIVEYTLGGDSPLVGSTVRDLALPDGAVVAMVVRGERIIAPRGSTRIQANDHVFVVVMVEVRAMLDDVFIRGRDVATQLAGGGEFPLRGSTTLDELKELYEIEIEGDDGSRTLGQLLAERLGERVAVGRGMRVGPFKLRVRELVDGRIEAVDLVILPPEDGPSPG